MLDSQERENYTRIACLTIREGTDRIRAKTMSNLSGSQSFRHLLQQKKNKFNWLKNRGVISKLQYNILYPSAGDIHLTNIDMTLWVVLARNLSIGSRCINWVDQPSENDVMWQHDALRLKEIRNKLFHVQSPELPPDTYLDFKNELVCILMRLGSHEDVLTEYFTMDLDPQQKKICEIQVREQCLEELYQLSVAAMHQRKQAKIVATILGILTVLIAVAIIVPTVLYLTRKPPCGSAIWRLSADSGVLNYISRSGWGALPRRFLRESPIPLLPKPVKKAVLFNAAIVENCDITSDCCATVKYLQEMEYKSKRVKWQDISYNFLIGNDGVVYEGRGAHYVGGAAWHHNSDIVSIGFLGNFICDPPSRSAVMALYVFLDYIQHHDPTSHGTPQAILDKDYQIYGHCQINLRTPEHNLTFSDSPGAAFMKEIRLWNKLSQENMTHCHLDVDCLRPPECCIPCNMSGV